MPSSSRFYRYAFGFVLLAVSLLCCDRAGEAASAAALAATPIAVANPAPAGSLYPNLLAGEEGLVLSWLEETDTLSRLRAAFFRNGQWTEPRTLISGRDWFVNWADFPSLAFHSDGSLLTYTLPKSDSGTFAYDIALYHGTREGTEWRGPLRPHTDGTATEHGFVSFFPLGRAGTGMVWLDGRNAAASGHGGHGHGDGHETDMLLQFARIDASGQLTPDTTLDTRVCSCCQTAAAALPGDGAIVFYRDRSPEEIRDISYVRYLNGRWTPPRTLSADNWKIAGCPVNGPAADSRGQMVAVAWFSAANNQPRVQVAFSANAGETFPRAVPISTGPALGRVALVLEDAQTAVVSYIDMAGEKQPELWLKRVHAERGVVDSLLVGPVSGARDMGFPRLARQGNRYYLAWTRDEEPTGVEMREVVW